MSDVAMEGVIPSPDAGAQQEAPSEVQQPKDDFSRRFELLTRKEREIQEQHNRFKSEQAKWHEKEQKLSEYESHRQLAERDPISFMEKYGWTPEKLTDYMINSPADPYAAKYQQKMDSLENKLKEIEQKTIEERRRETYYKQINSIQSFVDQDPDRFELVRENNAYGTVFEVMSEYYTKHGERLDEKKAAEVVENYLEKQLDRVLNYKKLKSKFGATNKPQEEHEEFLDQPAPSYQQSRPSTLTNSSFAPVNAPSSNRALSKEESLQRAAKLIRWND